MSGITHEISLDQFHEQIRFALDQYKNHGKKASDFQHVVIGGLGGSGIGGRIARLAYYTAFPIPIEVFSEYTLPAYVSSKTLVILCSYSGNTEETLAMFSEAQKKGSTIICLASGGKLKAKAEENECPFYQIPEGYQPRMALGFSLSYLLLLLGELAGFDMSDRLVSAEEMLKNNTILKARAKDIFELFKSTIAHKFVVVCDMAFEAVAVRFCQQIQENAKGEAFISVIPEANHNMIESYYSKLDTNFIFLNSALNQRNTARFKFLKGILESRGNVIYEYPISHFDLNTLFEVIHVTDWLSIYASNEKMVNNMEVGIISELKKYLDNV